jgi:hypothetical protein
VPLGLFTIAAAKSYPWYPDAWGLHAVIAAEVARGAPADAA